MQKIIFWSKIKHLVRYCLIQCACLTGTAGKMKIYWARCPAGMTTPAIVLFPVSGNTLYCGLAGLISIHKQPDITQENHCDQIDALIKKAEAHPLKNVTKNTAHVIQKYLDGEKTLTCLCALVAELKREKAFVEIFGSKDLQNQLHQAGQRLENLILQETRDLISQTGLFSPDQFKTANQYLEKLKDIGWSLQIELLANITKVNSLMANCKEHCSPASVKVFRQINAVLNSIDRLEVRGRDSAGISLLFLLDQQTASDMQTAISEKKFDEVYKQRLNHEILSDESINVHYQEDSGLTAIAFAYKVASEIGSLGDNVQYLRKVISEDPLLHLVMELPYTFHTINSHTRWASIGAITIANCHPLDNATHEQRCGQKGIIHVCLNGDIDNYLELKKQWLKKGQTIAEEITTDTKIIPLQIEMYLRQGHNVEKAFRLALNDFEGSHAISMHTDMEPGKFFLAQKGSGQAVFVGLAKDHYLPASEVYGFVEETCDYIKLDGEKTIQAATGSTQGQIFILDQKSSGGLEGIRAMYYDGTAIALQESNIQHTQISSRDIDRQNFPHYFLKEISEAPDSVYKTLQNRWKISKEDPDQLYIALEETSFSKKLQENLKAGQIKRIFFIGQGTAGIAANASADILNYYLNEPSLNINALKASELSGFKLEEHGSCDSMADALVIAISQSGTTTDTNRAVDMARALGAHTLAIVNRRDSDITFKADSVIYTSSGRDIEMSVASTKAFYSQIIAGALMGLKISEIMQRRSAAFISGELKALRELPDQMRKVLELKEQIKTSAQRLAPSKTYWAAVGSGPNKAAADEIRIKLSELCYKTISSDYVEDKKHIDLSSEPLILVCAAGAGSTVINDIIKDTAIFKAHKASPVVIADEDETRFDPYADDVIRVPSIPGHLAPVLNTLAGHLWGYYAALAINDGSKLLHNFREDIRAVLDNFTRKGLNIYEVILEKRFREKIARFYTKFRNLQKTQRLPSIITHATDLLLLFKYLTGRLPVSDFEMDFGVKGTPLNMLNTLLDRLGHSINGMSRPVDAIKHQAKTVTVGTSRIREKIEGILFEYLEKQVISTAQLINRNIIVLKNLQGIVSKINGSILYRISGLNVLGEPTEDSVIEIISKEGVLKDLPSRVEKDNSLKGTKNIIVRQGNIYVGKGRKDARSILVIPVISTDPAASNTIEHLLLLNISFKEKVDLAVKIKALGGKYEHIKNIVQENSIVWQDHYLQMVETDELFGRSAEKIGEFILLQLNQKKTA